MTEESWEPARLIPVSGINGAEEQERRGVSALLAVIESVREFGRAVTTRLGAPAGTISTFIEVTFPNGERNVRPDGVIRVVRGSRSWTALVEVKTGRNDLVPEQVEAYLEVARDHGFDAVLTISNQLVSAPGETPLEVDRRKTKKVALHHLSWSQLHTEAVVERVNRSVSDPDQAWILSELIRYLEHARSGAVDFDDMGIGWVPVRDAVAQRTLRLNDKNAIEVVHRFGHLVAFAGMRLSRDLGVDVRPSFTRADLQDRTQWLQSSVATLVDRGMLHGTLKVPNAVAPFTVTADLRTGRVSCSLTIDAPGDGRATTRVNWLVRQLAAASDGLLIEAVAARSRRPGAAHPLAALREAPHLLIDDPTKELKSFTLTLGVVSGTKRGQGRGSFVGSVLDLCDRFYEEVVQNLRPWSPTAPKVKGAQVVDDDVATGEILGELPIRGDVAHRIREVQEAVREPEDDVDRLTVSQVLESTFSLSGSAEMDQRLSGSDVDESNDVDIPSTDQVEPTTLDPVLENAAPVTPMRLIGVPDSDDGDIDSDGATGKQAQPNDPNQPNAGGSELAFLPANEPSPATAGG